MGYSDVNRVSCLETLHSTYGYYIFLGGNLISWSAKKQPIVSGSSCEYDYYAMANTTAEVMWITHLPCELHALPPGRPIIFCDNKILCDSKSAIFLTQNLVDHKGSKHVVTPR